MKALLYPLAASKMLRHSEVFLLTMKAMKSDELVELAFNEFVTSSDRTLQYLAKELNAIGGVAPSWFRDRRDNLPDREVFCELRHIIAHHFFIPLTPIISIKQEVPSQELQVSEYRLDLEMMPKDKNFDKKKVEYIKKYGASVNAVTLSQEYYDHLSCLIKEAERKYGNFEYFKRNKVKSTVRISEYLTLLHEEKQF